MSGRIPTVAESRYLQGNFAPVTEEVTAHDLPVSGHLPDHLDGRYLRNGPNPVTTPTGSYHWFIGAGMVHGVRLRDGQAQWYRNRWVRAPSVTEPLGEPFHGDAGTSDFAPNTNVLEHAGRTLALVEAGTAPYELTHELDTVGPCDFDGTLPNRPGLPGYTAHPHRDPVSGELHAVSYKWLRGNRVDYSVIDTSGRVRHSVEIRVQGSPMIHDFALTEHNVVVFDLPVTFDTDLATRGARRLAKPMLRGLLKRVVGHDPLPESWINRIARGDERTPTWVPYRWNPDYPARVGILPRDGGSEDVRWFEIEPCYVFHLLNAYDEGETVVVDVIRHPRMFAEHLDGPDEGAPTLTRFTLDIATGHAREEGINQRPQEFPRHDERLTGRRHRYGYTQGFEGGAYGDLVLKHDLDTRRTEARSLGAATQTSEFCFVPTPGGTAEDDGVLLGYVFDREKDRSDLRVLDAATLEDVASVHLPARVPAGFHGNWAPAAGSAIAWQ